MKLLNFFRRSKSHSSKTEHDRLVEKFQKKFKCGFKRPGLLIRALTHRSYVHYDKTIKISNERMEYLGDSVLGMVVAEHLFETFPDYNEGDLTKTKSMLVNEITLSTVGRDCGLNGLILMSPDEERAGGRTRSSIVSDTVEAVIAAIYLDGGLDAARRFIKRLIISHADEILNDSAQRNYKGELLEYMQGMGFEPPHYDVVSEEGPDHQKTFEVVVYTDGEITGSGSGPSKKEAEQIAASKSLELLIKKREKSRPNED